MSKDLVWLIIIAVSVGSLGYQLHRIENAIRHLSGLPPLDY